MRIRTIKPEFWTDKKVASWDHFTRLVFIGLWSAADDHGRGSAEAARLAAELFPYDISRDPIETLARVAASLDTIAKTGRIALYAVDGEKFYEVAHWARHQRVDNAGKPRVPTPSDGAPVNPRETRREPPRTSAGTGNREQGDGTGNREQVGAQGARRFQPPTREQLDLEAAKIGLLGSEVDKFVGHYGANGWKVGKNPMKSWQHALAGWAARWREQNGNHAIRQRPGGPDLNAHVAGVADRIRERREQWASEDPNAPPPGFEREPGLALPGLGAHGDAPEG